MEMMSILIRRKKEIIDFVYIILFFSTMINYLQGPFYMSNIAAVQIKLNKINRMWCCSKRQSTQFQFNGSKTCLSAFEYSNSLSHYKFSKHLNKCSEHLSIAIPPLLRTQCLSKQHIYANMSSFALSLWLLSNESVLEKKNWDEIFFALSTFN